MIWSRIDPSEKKLLGIRLEPEQARQLVDLCKYYHLPKDDVIAAIIAQEHEAVVSPRAQKGKNPFVVTPVKING